MRSTAPSDHSPAARPAARPARAHLAMAAVASVLAAAGVVIAAPVLSPAAQAQEEPQGASYLTPFPPGDVYQTLVVGDTFAEGILFGLVDSMGADLRLTIQRKHKPVAGVMTSEHAEHLRQLEETIAREPPQIAVVMLGEDDRQPLRPPSGGKRIPVGADEWKAEYGRRIDRLMKTLKKSGAAVYWVGLPNLRRPEANDDAQMMNEIIRERGYLNGIKYIDAFAGFTDDGGGYSAYGPDLTGKIRLLREGDGINFTAAGNRKLAHFLERELKRDLGQAKSERTIPLAGNPSEQEKINKEQREAAARLAAQAMAETSRQGNAARQTAGAMASAAAQVAAAATAGSGEQKADNTRISLRSVGATGRDEIVQIDIVRPAIPASVVALVTRRESPDKASQMGETLLDQIAGGMTVMSTITPSSSTGPGAGRQRLSPTQTPFFRVLVKGERLPPLPGRADDQSWPRPEAAAPLAGPAAAATPATPSAAPAATKPAQQKPGAVARDVVKDQPKPSVRPASPKDAPRAPQPRG